MEGKMSRTHLSKGLGRVSGNGISSVRARFQASDTIVLVNGHRRRAECSTRQLSIQAFNASRFLNTWRG